MTQQPTPPPTNEPVLSYHQTQEGIRQIAKRQRAIMLCILTNIVLYVVLLAGGQGLPLAIRLVLFLAMLTVNVLAAVNVFGLAIKLYGTAVGIFCGIATLIPCIGLLVLFVVSGRATDVLKKQGIKVGLLGAKLPDQF